MFGYEANVAMFIPHYATVCHPFFDCLRDHRSKEFDMTEEAYLACEKIKNFLCQQTILYNVDYSLPLYLCTDANQVGMNNFFYTSSKTMKKALKG